MMPRIARAGNALIGRLVVAELSEAINLDEIAVGLPRRIHEVTARQVAKAPDRIALVEDGASWSYRDLDQRVSEIAAVLSSLGIRAGDRMIIVSENCIALAALAAGGEPARRLGDRRQSAIVGTRTGPDPRP